MCWTRLIERLLVCRLVAAFLIAALGLGQTANAVELGVGDKVKVMVQGQPDFTGEFEITTDGTVIIPFVGPVAISGLDEVAASDKIKQRLAAGYLKLPQVDVRIVEVRSIYVTGGVKSPGRYPFRLGATAMTAIAEAGGIGAAQQTTTELVAGLIAAEERVELLHRQQLINLIRLSGARAELQGVADLDLRPLSPPQIGGQVGELLNEERKRLKTALNDHERKVRSFTARKILLQRAVTKLEAGRKLKQEQLEVVTKRINAFRRLSKQGLGTLATELSVRRDEIQTQSEIVELERAIVLTNLELQKIEADLADLMTNRRTRLVTEIEQLSAKQQEIDVQLPAAQKMLNWRRLDSSNVVKALSQQSYRIVLLRNNNQGGSDEEVIARTTRLKPGDLIDVQMKRLHNDKDCNFLSGEYCQGSEKQSFRLPPDSTTDSLNSSAATTPPARAVATGEDALGRRTRAEVNSASR